MPIGTTSTAILLNINKPKHNITSQQQEHKSWWWEILEMIGVQVIAVALAPFTGGLSESLALSLGASDLLASISAVGVEFLTDFTINQIYDYLKGNVTPLNAFFNILPAFAGLNRISRGYRTTKFISLAEKTKTLEQIGIKKAKNLQEIISQVSEKQFLTDKIIGNKRYLFNYNHAPNRETIIQNLGFVAERQYKNNFAKLEVQELKNYLLLQNELIKLSPQLTPKFKIKDIDKANNFLQKYNTDLKEVLKMNQHDWLNLVHTIHAENRYGKYLILDLQKIRANAIKFNFKNSSIHKLVLKANQTFKYFDIKFYFKKGLNKFWKDTSYFEKIRINIYKLQEKFEKLEKQAFEKINKLKEKTIDLFTSSEKKAIKHAQLIPLNSPVFMACKIQPLSLDKCGITIYHRNPKYKPIVVIDSIIKAETFVIQIHPFHWYSIIREINRNKDNNHYFSLIAQNKAENRKQSHISFHKFKNKNLVKYVQQKLLLGWSPEQIYGRIKNFHKEWVISFKTIYSWIYFGMLDKVTSKNLRRKGKKRKSKENRGKFNGKSIKERDINVNDRIKLGHWEGYTIVSSRGKSKSCLITLVERVSRFTLAILVKNRTTKVINKNVSYYLSILPKNIVKTITFDRGKEFSNWQQLEKNLDVKIYFANPYSPWQRGTNENTNGLIREKFPKKFIFSKTNKNEVHKFILSLNQRPRKILNYLSPIEYLDRKII